MLKKIYKPFSNNKEFILLENKDLFKKILKIYYEKNKEFKKSEAWINAGRFNINILLWSNWSWKSTIIQDINRKNLDKTIIDDFFILSKLKNNENNIFKNIWNSQDDILIKIIEINNTNKDILNILASNIGKKIENINLDWKFKSNRDLKWTNLDEKNCYELLKNYEKWIDKKLDKKFLDWIKLKVFILILNTLIKLSYKILDKHKKYIDNYQFYIMKDKVDENEYLEIKECRKDLRVHIKENIKLFNFIDENITFLIKKNNWLFSDIKNNYKKEEEFSLEKIFSKTLDKLLNTKSTAVNLNENELLNIELNSTIIDHSFNEIVINSNLINEWEYDYKKIHIEYKNYLSYFNIIKYFLKNIEIFGDDQSNIKNLSSWEKMILFRFGSLYQKIIERKNEQQSDFIILIDEPDLHLHMEWQKKYIKTLFNIFWRLDQSIKIHFIIATHSPFIVSDLPKECIIKLEDWKINPEIKQTFWANFINIIDDSFYFDKKNLIWSFAESVIKGLEEHNKVLNLLSIFEIKKEEDFNKKKDDVNSVLDKIGLNEIQDYKTFEKEKKEMSYIKNIIWNDFIKNNLNNIEPNETIK